LAGARRLKVFLARIGFHDSVVAAPSQAAALRAWGVHQNLFADGQAKIAEDADAVAAALAHPETPLRRAIGSTEPFGLDGGLARIDAPPKAAKGRRNAPAKPVKPPPDRSKLDAAEAALAKVETGRKRALDRVLRQREALDAEEAEARESWDQRQAEAKAAVARERQAYRDR
jgi:hypothetical protein